MRVVSILAGGILLAGLFLLWSQQPPRPRDSVNLTKANRSSVVIQSQPKEGRISGFGSHRVPLNAGSPVMSVRVVRQKSARRGP